VGLEGFGKRVPDAVQREALARQKEIASGALQPFAAFDAAVRDNSGQEVIAKGQSLTDDQILKMNYLVEGVVGKVGK
jgi:basic membrane protein A and related proteins